MLIPPGTYRPSIQRHNTFLPDPLPPTLALSVQVERQVEEATYLLGQFEMCRTLLPNADILGVSLIQMAIAGGSCASTQMSMD